MKNILKILFSLIFSIISFQNVFAREESCPEGRTLNAGQCVGPEDFVSSSSPDTSAAAGKNPIQCGKGGLAGAGCSVNINKLVGVKGAQDGVESRKNLLTFTTDAVSGLTLFIGTLVLIALIYSGFLYVMAGGDEKQAEKGKNGIKNSIIGLILVLLSYTIIRAVQYFANGS